MGIGGGVAAIGGYDRGVAAIGGYDRGGAAIGGGAFGAIGGAAARGESSEKCRCLGKKQRKA